MRSFFLVVFVYFVSIVNNVSVVEDLQAIDEKQYVEIKILNNSNEDIFTWVDDTPNMLSEREKAVKKYFWSPGEHGDISFGHVLGEDSVIIGPIPLLKKIESSKSFRYIMTPDEYEADAVTIYIIGAESLHTDYKVNVVNQDCLFGSDTYNISANREGLTKFAPIN